MGSIKFGKTQRTSVGSKNKWLRNASQSMGMITKDLIKQQLPTTFDTSGSVVSEMKDMYSFLSNFQMMDKEDSVISDLKQGVKNVVNDLKSGNLNNEDRMMSAMFGDDFNMDELLSDDYNFGSDSNGSIKSAMGDTETIVNTMVSTTEATYSIMKTNAAISRHTGNLIGQGLTAINDNLSKLVEFNTKNMNSMIMSTLAYHEKHMQMMEEQTKSSYESRRQVSVADDFMGSGSVDMNFYKNVLKKNFGDVMDTSMIGLILNTTAGDPSMRKMLLANPVGGALSMGLSAAMPAMLKKSLTTLDKSLETFLPAMFLKLGDMAEDYSKNAMQRMIGQLFGVNTEYKHSVDMSKVDMRAKQDFDKETKRAIVETIPTYLRKILSAINGKEEEVFDNKTGRFRKYSDMANEYHIDRRRSQIQAYDMSISDIMGSLEKSGAVKNNKSSELRYKIEEFFIENSKRGTIMDLTKNSSMFKDTAKSANMNKKESEILFNLLKQMPKSQLMSLFGGKMAKSRIDNNRHLDSLADDPNSSFYTMLGEGVMEEATLKEEFLQWKKATGGKKISDFKKYRQEMLDSRDMSMKFSPFKAGDESQKSTIGYLKSIYQLLSDGITVFMGSGGPKGPRNRGRRRGTKSSSSNSNSSDSSDEGPSNTVNDINLDDLEFSSWEDSQFEPNFIDKWTEKNAGKKGIGGSLASLINIPTKIMERMSHKVDEFMYTAIFGKENELGEKTSFFQSMTEGVQNYWNTTSAWMSENIFTPMKEMVFGENGLVGQIKKSDPYMWMAGKVKDFKDNVIMGQKDENGNHQGGIFSDTTNEMKDMLKAVGYQFTGKAYTDSKGAAFAATNKSVFGETAKVFKDLGDGLRQKIFGEDEPGKEKEPMLTSMMNSIGEGFQNFSNVIFGPKEFSNGKLNPKHKAMDDFGKSLKDKLPKALSFGIIGGGATLLSGGSMGLLGSLFLPGGPIGGLLVGSAVGMATQSDKVKNFIFGEKDIDGKRIGGLVSKDTGEFLKNNKTAMIGGAALGMVKSLTMGNGLLTSMFLPGGPIGGAMMGIASSLIFKSNTVQDFLFGKEIDNGKRAGGVFSQVMNHFKGSGVPGLNKDTMKNVAAGTVSGAVLSSVIGNMGLLGAMATMGGSPILGSLVGAAAGITLSSEKWTKSIFGEIDENSGDRKGGLLTSVTNWMNVNMARPIADKVAEYKLNMEDWFTTAIANPFFEAVDPVVAQFKFVFEDLKDKVVGTVTNIASKVGDFGKTYIADPMVDAFKSHFLDPLTKSLDWMIKGSAKVIGNIIASPIKLMSWAAGGFEKKHEKRGLKNYKSEEWDSFKSGDQGLLSTIGNMYFNKEKRNEARTSEKGAYYKSSERDELIRSRKEERRLALEEKKANLAKRKEQTRLRQEMALQLGYDNFDKDGANKSFVYDNNVEFKRDSKSGKVVAFKNEPETKVSKAMEASEKHLSTIENSVVQIYKWLKTEGETKSERIDSSKKIEDVMKESSSSVKSGGVNNPSGTQSARRLKSAATLPTITPSRAAFAPLGGSTKIKSKITSIFGKAHENLSPKIQSNISKGVNFFQNKFNSLTDRFSNKNVNIESPVTDIPSLSSPAISNLALPAPSTNQLALPGGNSTKGNQLALPAPKTSIVPSMENSEVKEGGVLSTLKDISTSIKDNNDTEEKLFGNLTSGSEEKVETDGMTSPLNSPESLESIMDKVADENRAEAKLETEIDERGKSLYKKNVGFIREEQARIAAEIAEADWKDEMLTTVKGIYGALGMGGEKQEIDPKILAALAAIAGLLGLLGQALGSLGGWFGENVSDRTLGDGSYVPNMDLREAYVKMGLKGTAKTMAKLASSDVGKALYKGTAKMGEISLKALKNYVGDYTISSGKNTANVLGSMLDNGAGDRVLYGEVVDDIPWEKHMDDLGQEAAKHFDDLMKNDKGQKLLSSALPPTIYDPANATKTVYGEIIDDVAKKNIKTGAEKGIKAGFTDFVDISFTEVGAKKATDKSLRHLADEHSSKLVKRLSTHLGKAFKSFFNNGTIKKALGGAKYADEAADAVWKFFADQLANTGKSIAKYAPKIQKALIDAAASVGITLGTAGMVDLVFGAWDATTGMAEASRLFKISGEDVDWNMRMISGVMKAMLGWSFIGALVDVACEIIEDMTSGTVAVKSSVAEILYRIISNDENDAKLEEAQMKFHAEYEKWKIDNLENADTEFYVYNDLMNKTVFERYFYDPWQNFKKDAGKNTIEYSMDFIAGEAKQIIKHGPKAVAEKALKPLVDNNIARKLGEFTKYLARAVHKFFSGTTIVKKIGESAAGKCASKMVDMLKGAVESIAKSPSLLKKFMPRLAQAMTESAVSMGVSFASAGLVDLGFAVWDGATGMAEASRLFKVSGEDVDWIMRFISGTIKLVLGFGFIGPLVDVAAEIYEELSGVGFKSMIAEFMYDIIADEKGEAKLDEAQDRFYAEWEAENSSLDPEDQKTFEEWNRDQNKTVFQKYISDPFKEWVINPVNKYFLEPVKDFAGSVGKGVKEGMSWVGEKISTGAVAIADGVKSGAKWIYEESPIAAFNSDHIRKTLGMDEDETVKLHHRIAEFSSNNWIVKAGEGVLNLFGADIKDGDTARWLTDNMEKAGSSIKEFTTNAVDNVTRFIKEDSPFAFFSEDTIKDTFNYGDDTQIELKDRFSVAIGKSFDSFLGLFGVDVKDKTKSSTVILGAIATLEDTAEDFWVSISRKATEAFDSLKEGIPKAFENMDKGMGNLLGLTDDNGNPIKMSEGVKEGWNDFRSFSKDLVNNSKEWWRTTSNNISDYWNQTLLPGIQNAPTAMNMFMGRMLGFTDENGTPISLTQGVGTGWENLKTTASDMTQQLGAWWNESWTNVSEYWNSNILPGIKQSGTKIDKALGRLLGFTDDEGTQLTLTEGVSRSYDKAKSNVLKTLEKANSAWEATKEKASEIADKTIKNVKDSVSKFDKMVGSFLGFTDKNGNPLSLSDALKNTWKSITDLPKLVADGFKNAADTVMKHINNFIDDLFNKGKKEAESRNSSGKGGRGTDILGSILPQMSELALSVDRMAKESKVSFGKGGGQSSPSTNHGFKYYSQNDPRWSNNYYGSDGPGGSKSFGDRGCGPTAMAMVASELTGNDITPDQMGRVALNRGYSVESGTNWAFVPSVSQDLGLQTRNVSREKSSIANELRSGKPMILSGQRRMGEMGSPYTTGGHYVVATGINGNKVKISDPLSPGGNGVYDLDKIADGANVAWSFSNSNRPQGMGNIKKISLNESHPVYGLGMTKGEKVVESAAKLIGKPYIYGGNYPPLGNSKGTDCSGLCQWAYNDALGSEYKNFFGSRWTTSTINGARNKTGVTQIKNKEDLRPGDLVLCNGNGSSWSHVVIWEGPQGYIHAPQSGKNITRGDYYVLKKGPWLGIRILDDSIVSSSGTTSETSGTTTVPKEWEKPTSFTGMLSEYSLRLGQLSESYYNSAVFGADWKGIDWTDGQTMTIGGNSTTGNSSSTSNGGNFGSDTIGKMLSDYHNLSGIFEVGGQDPKSVDNFDSLSGKVSNTPGDHGGKSYGLPQFSLKMGSLKNFVNWLSSNHPDLYSSLKGKSLGGSAFDTAWRSLAGEKFKLAQWQFSDKSFFNPGMDVAQKKGLKNTDLVTIRSIVNSAVKQRGTGGSFPGVMAKGNVSDPKQQVTSMFDHMIGNVNTHFRSSSSSVRSGVKNRFNKEKNLALQMIDREVGGGRGNIAFGKGCDNTLEYVPGINKYSTEMRKLDKENMNNGGLGGRGKYIFKSNINKPIFGKGPEVKAISRMNSGVSNERYEARQILSVNNEANNNLLLQKMVLMLSQIANNTGMTVNAVVESADKIVSSSSRGNTTVMNTMVSPGGTKVVSVDKKEAPKPDKKAQKAMSIAKGLF